MNDSLKNLFTVSDLRNRILFTLGMLAVYRVGHHITVPGVNLAALDELARQMQNNMFGLYDMFSGGNLSRVTIFAPDAASASLSEVQYCTTAIKAMITSIGASERWAK